VDSHTYQLVLPAVVLLRPRLVVICGGLLLGIRPLISGGLILVFLLLLLPPLLAHDLVEGVGFQVEDRGEFEERVDLVVAEGVEIEDYAL
jgi:hypothetical protein